MIISVLFIASAVSVICWVSTIVAWCLGQKLKLPVPLLHPLDVTFGNTYISTPSLAFQLWFWFHKYGII
jgi:hypothetical protein